MIPLLNRLNSGSTPAAMELLAPEMHRFGPWTETVAITLIACALGWWIEPDDPLLLNSDFPWLWLAPVLIALRYGLMPGMFSALGLLGDWALFTQQSTQAAEFPRGYFVGGSLLTLICGEFNAVWGNRLEQRSETGIYLGERLNRLTRRYLLLRLSHDRIEQELLLKPGSLRDALLRLREFNPGTSERDPLPGIDELLQLMSQYCQLEAAVIYPVPRQKSEHFKLTSPITTLGEPHPLRGDDPMLLMAMERRSLVHIAEQTDAQQLVIAPILTSDDQLLGLLAVSRMPFFALNHDNLQLLDLLLGYYADVVHGGGDAQALRQQLPGCPWPFVEELVRVQRIQQRIGMTSHIVVFRFCGDKAYEIAGELERMRRTLDVIWSVDRGTKPALAVLLPLSARAASEEYILRIQHWLKDRYGMDVGNPGVDIVNIELGRDDAVARLQKTLLVDDICQ